jgi:hypothetical protein
MSGNELAPRRASLPARLRKAVFVDWYGGEIGIHFDIYAGDPAQYSAAALEAVKHLKGLQNVIVNSKAHGGELIIVGHFTAAYRHNAPKIARVISQIEKLLDTPLRYIAYVPGDGWLELPLVEWARLRW